MKQISRHHVFPKQRQKMKNVETDMTGLLFTTTFRIYRDKHDCWHTLFRNATLTEAILILQRLQRMLLARQRKENKRRPNDSYFERNKPPSKKKTEPHY